MKKAPKKLSKMFRPNNYPKQWLIKERRQGRSYGGSFRIRKDYPFKLVNERAIGRIFSRLHYLACHAPDKVNEKWNRAYYNFQYKYFAAKGKHSVRFANEHTCDRFL